MPACYTQVDFVFGSEVNPLTYAAYGDKKVGSPGAPGNASVGPSAWYNGGTRLCDPRPTATFTSQCDGSMQVKLANGSAANIDAVFTVTAGGESARYRIAKGTNQSVKIFASAASNVQVQDNVPDGDTFETVTGRWSKPKGC